MRLKKHLLRVSSVVAASAVMSTMILAACGPAPSSPDSASASASNTTISSSSIENKPASSSSTSGAESEPASSNSSSSPESKPTSSSNTSTSDAESKPASSSSTSSSSSSTSNAESQPASSSSSSSPASKPASSSASGAESEPASSSSSSSAESKPAKEDEEQFQSLLVEDCGYYYTGRQGSNYCYNFYYFKIKNPNKDKAVKNSKINYVIRNSDNKILTSTVIYLPAIAADDTVEISGSVIVSASENPASAEYKIEYNKYGIVDQETAKVVKSSELVVSNPYRVKSGAYAHFTGEVTNKSDQDLTSVKVMLLYRKDGRIYGGDSWLVGTLAAGETKAFDMITLFELSEYDSYTIVAVHG